MGCYLAKPVTEKEVEDINGKDLRVGACSMQGWRNGQEDAHSIELELTPEISLFAVFDGHGGPEVAEWSSKSLPKFIKNELKNQNLECLSKFSEKLKEIFVQHDENILSASVIAELHAIAGRDPPPTEKDEIQGELDDLEEEAEMTHEELLAKYGIDKDDYKQKEQIANIIMSQFADIQDAAGEDDSDSAEDEEDSKPKNGTKSLNDMAAKFWPKMVENEETGNYKPEERDRRTLSAEERAKRLEDANNENGEGGTLIEDHSEASSEPSSEEENENDNNPLLRSEDHEVCGHDSGTTCILTLYKHETQELLVGNIGDSRAVLCRGGLAVDLSLDHKPEDEIELNRIKKAGGYLTGDGRVKGGLNLSRAFGDHMYKDNSAIPLKDQMITAFPDVKYCKLTKEDEFLVLACDGIWNVMTSQECIDFVRDRLEKDNCVSDILSELFDQCLAPDTQGDGTGCDNMTGIIVQLRPKSQTLNKRPRSSDEESAENPNQIPKVSRIEN